MISKEQIDEMINTLESLGYVVINANDMKYAANKVERAIEEFKQMLTSAVI